MDATPVPSGAGIRHMESRMGLVRLIASVMAVGLLIGAGRPASAASADEFRSTRVSHASIAPTAARNGPKHPSARRSGPSWVSRPYLRPMAGVGIWGGSSGRTTSVSSLGAEAGIVYRQVGRPLPRWRVTPRARGVLYSSSDGVAGHHARVGVRAGPWWKKVGIASGPDLYRDQLRVGEVRLDPITGIAMPVMGFGRVGPVGLQAGFEPSWFLSGERPAVDWSRVDARGFGDEFAWLAGANVRLCKMSVGVRWTRRITAAGAGTDWSVGAGLRL